MYDKTQHYPNHVSISLTLPLQVFLSLHGVDLCYQDHVVTQQSTKPQAMWRNEGGICLSVLISMDILRGVHNIQYLSTVIVQHSILLKYTDFRLVKNYLLNQAMNAPKLSWRRFKATWHEIADHVDVMTSANFTALSITSCLTHHVSIYAIHLQMNVLYMWSPQCQARASCCCCSVVFRVLFWASRLCQMHFFIFYFFHAHKVQRKLQEYTCCGGTLKVFTHCRLPQIPLVKVSAFISFITAPAPQLTYLHSRWLVWW